MTAVDIKALATLTEQVQRDLREKPAWRLLYTGAFLLTIGLIANIAISEASPEINERWDGPAAVAAAIGGIFIATALAVRILQHSRRDEITEAVTEAVTEALAKIETERARRDFRLADDVIEPLADLVRHLSVQVEALRSEVAALHESVEQQQEQADTAIAKAKAEAYVDMLNGVANVTKLPAHKRVGPVFRRGDPEP